ncbi:MAG: carbamoyltransferase [Bacteroidota bacterium]
MKILGISAFYHDSAAAIIENGRVLAAAQEERFTRKKQDAVFPKHAIEYCLQETGTSIDDLSAVVFYDKPLLKFERLLETYYAFIPKGLASFISAMPVWLKEKLFLKKLLRDGLAEIEDYDRKQLTLLFPEHHLSHAASTFYPSPFEAAAILTIDGVGEWATASLAHGQGKDITILKELHFPHSVGLLYAAFTYFLGFKVNSGEYKMMGLAPYGNLNDSQTRSFIEKIKDQLITIHEDGSIWLDQRYFNYATGLRMVREKAWEQLFGIPKRVPETELEQAYANMALAIQKVTEEIVYKMAKHLKDLTHAKALCLSGGVALNCVANGQLVRSGLFEQIYIQPASGDAGGALGAALAAWHIHFEKERFPEAGKDQMQHAYLGPEFSDLEIQRVARQFKAPYRRFDDLQELYQEVAKLLADQQIVGWFQGRMEFGPRALGNRSILADPRDNETQQTLNLKIKFRESFRPFAPSILVERIGDYFEPAVPSPYMLLVLDVHEKQRKQLPEDYDQLEIREKLKIMRSTLPAITHIDMSARVQSVEQSANPRYHGLISAFEAQTGCPVLVNTSFNVRGEPIVCRPEEAYRCFMKTNMDVLVLGDFVFLKTQQPAWPELQDAQVPMALD